MSKICFSCSSESVPKLIKITKRLPSYTNIFFSASMLLIILPLCVLYPLIIKIPASVSPLPSPCLVSEHFQPRQY